MTKLPNTLLNYLALQYFDTKFKTVKCEIYPRYDFNGLGLVLDMKSSVCDRNLKNGVNV
jgi:hypothetical protein